MRISWTIVLVSCVLPLAGCSGVPATTPIETTLNAFPGVALHGMVHGGQQPIVGAKVYLYAATDTSGYGGASQSLLANPVTTQAGGAFSISGDYTCPSEYSQVYLYAAGGDPGLGEGANPAIGLMAALGTCNSLKSSAYVVINEVSTIATAYALAGFAVDATHVGSSSSTLATDTNVPNAFATATNLESLSTGNALATTPAPASNGTVPQAEIDTLADILAACVNSNGALTGPPNATPCYTLFNSALSGGTTGTTPAETATAAINIAHNPGSNVATLFGLLPPNLAFQPTLGGPPNDFTIAITYSGGGLDGTGFAPEGIAIDASGNVWVPNYDSSSLSEFTSNGAPKSGSPYGAGGMYNPTSVAIDIYGSAWIANFAVNEDNEYDISEFNYKGSSISPGPPGFTGGGLSKPYGIAFDKTGDAWVADEGGNNLAEFESATGGGLPISGSNGFGSDVLGGPAGVAGDSLGNVWTANYTLSPSSLAEASPSSLPGGSPTITIFTGVGASSPNGAGLNSPYGVAIDGSGNVWASNQGGGGSISELSSSGQAVSGENGFTGGGVDDPYGIAIDGAGNVWTANYGGNANSISEFNSSGTPISGSNGYVSNGLFEPYGIAIDGSGNVWVASDNTSGPLTEFVGAATPVVTPLSAGAEYGELGTRP
ncbi:MAG: NHL repeat-containing protein [Terracidiphilus sp.]